MKRLMIYFFYDKEGMVDDYVPYFLNSFKPFCNEICTVVNGNLTDAARNKLAACSSVVLERENTGLDVEAYKYGLNYYGFENIKNNFDEVILTNFTIYGSFYPLGELFDNIEKNNCDWWAPFKWYIKYDDFRHMPSFFNVYKKNIILSGEFKKYWDSLPAIKTYADSVHYHEQRQTKYWQEAGFSEGTWIDDYKYKNEWDNHWPLTMADKVIIEDRYPFIKRRCFYNDSMLTEKQFALIKNVLRYLQNNRLYNVRLIVDNLLRTLDFKISGKERFKYYKHKLLYKFNKKKKDKYINQMRMYNLKKSYRLFLESVLATDGWC